MTIDAEKVGRNLHLTMEGVDEPFVIRPLPGNAGAQITRTYIDAALGNGGDKFPDALRMAVDGARKNAITGVWEPLPEAERTTYTRIGDELSQAESEEIVMAAFFWQTVLGMDGVASFLQGGGGIAGSLKAQKALLARLGLLARMTSPSSE